MNLTPLHLDLDSADLLSPTWRKIQEWAEASITRLHLHDENYLPDPEHHEMRGRIATLRVLLGSGQKPPSSQNTASNAQKRDTFNDMSLP